jgi:hypothetical protein
LVRPQQKHPNEYYRNGRNRKGHDEPRRPIYGRIHGPNGNEILRR